MEIQKEDILNSIRAKESNSGVIKRSKLNNFFDIAPEDFFKYACADIESDIEHRVVNVLSNTKRALDCQLDSILSGSRLFPTLSRPPAEIDILPEPYPSYEAHIDLKF